ncbi:prostatic acid phosphatase-like [Elgaria multicarinata webbii]|uniref:prostatic acid phosphatase-like n=1 Tax=Elgaria multicarinata webbii TaxID=159646 RepID=UPI002FCCC8F6
MNVSAKSPVLSFSRLGFYFLSLLFGLLLQSATGRELQFVISVFRHGDRTPVSTFPTNTVKENVWPQGYGQLTKIGMQQQYELGVFTKERYKHFLSKAYNRKEIYVRSTDYDRTIMSAQANLAGLFPPTYSEIWNENILWQPIPVHTVPRSDEKLLSYPIGGCPRFYQLLKETMADKTFQALLKGQMKFLARLAANVGYDLKTLLDFNNHKLWNVYDALLVQKIHKQARQQWAGAHAMKTLGKLMEHSLSAIFGGYKHVEKSRLQGGVFVKAILEKLKKIAQTPSGEKMILYSAHDITIAALQSSLGVFNGKLPPYAACHYFELYKEGNGVFTVQMYYRNSTSAPPHLLTMPGCSGACSLEKFEELVSPIITDNWNQECNSQMSTPL